MAPKTAAKTDMLRASMVLTAARWLPQRGMAAVNLIEVARAVGAPRGSIYHYFPGGRDQLLREALALAGNTGLRMVEKALRQSSTPDEFVQAFFSAGRQQVEGGFSGGCPVGAAVLSSQTESKDFEAALQDIFASWLAALSAAFESLGATSPSEAEKWASCSLVSLEGALVCAKGARGAQGAADIFDNAARMVQAVLAPRP